MSLSLELQRKDEQVTGEDEEKDETEIGLLRRNRSEVEGKGGSEMRKNRLVS